MTIQRVQTISSTQATANITVSYPQPVQAGHLLICTSYANHYADVLGPPNGWLKLWNSSIRISTTAQMDLFYKVATGTESAVNQQMPGATVMSMGLYEYAGASGAIDHAVWQSANSASAVSTLTVGVGLTTNPYSLLFMMLRNTGNSSGYAFSLGTVISNPQGADGEAYPNKIINQNLTCTWTGANYAAIAYAAFLPSAASIAPFFP